MPTYEYLCKKCGHAFEEFQSMVEDPLVRCPSCGTDSLARVLGTGGGVIFRGSGFYRTDYRKPPPPGGGAEAKSPPDGGKSPPASQPSSPPPEKKKD